MTSLSRKQAAQQAEAEQEKQRDVVESLRVLRIFITSRMSALDTVLRKPHVPLDNPTVVLLLALVKAKRLARWAGMVAADWRRDDAVYAFRQSMKSAPVVSMFVELDVMGARSPSSRYYHAISRLLRSCG